MNWADPAYAWLCLLLVPAAMLLRRTARRRRLDLLQLAGDDSPAQRPACRPVLGALLPAAAFLLIVAALCRPQWGLITLPQQSTGLNILVALDVSRSMLAEDLQPTRLAAAKDAVTGLLSQLQGDRIGLIAFAGSAFLVCPLTSDYGTFAAMLAEAGPDTLPLGGTSLGSVISEARRVFAAHQGSSNTLIVVSDGEDHGGDLGSVAGLGDAGITVHSLAAGTPAGSVIRLADGQFVRNRQGALVKTRLQTEALQQLAAAGGGRVFDLATDPKALETLYRNELAASERQASSTTRQQLAERFQFPLALALLLLLGEPLLAWRQKP
jgi:Ca-activated chloride channel family protein